MIFKNFYSQGYKVARVEQTETPEALAQRAASSRSSASTKVVRREVCQVITPGTWFASLRGEMAGDSSQSSSTQASLNETTQTVEFGANGTSTAMDLSQNRYLMVVLEDHPFGSASSSGASQTRFGLALLKAATGEIQVCV